ncbi:MAG: FG-GAP repeat protein, partial [bacterium]
MPVSAWAGGTGVAGDLALVGACGADPGGLTRAGAAYLFERNAGGTNAWGQVAKLTAADKAASDYFGCSVSVAGDVALIGAFEASPGGVIRAGAAYLFERNAGGTNAWGQVAKLTASDKAAEDSFGRSVSVAGDVALVGADYASPGGVDYAGAAYVFEGSLYGPPAITNVFRTANACSLCFDCQPAWRYDVQWRTNLLSGQWG